MLTFKSFLAILCMVLLPDEDRSEKD
jgi:hypothetical protein